METPALSIGSAPTLEQVPAVVVRLGEQVKVRATVPGTRPDRPKSVREDVRACDESPAGRNRVFTWGDEAGLS